MNKKQGLNLVMIILFSVFMAALIVLPFIALFINLLLLYVRSIYRYLFLINISFSAFLALAGFWFIKTKELSQKAPLSYRKPLYYGIVFSIIICFIIGTILILTITPYYI